MTRFVGENTGQRVAAGARWGVEDLRKRPAPLSSGSIPCFRMLAFNVTNTVTNNNPTTMAFDIWENEDAAVFDPTVIGGTPDTVQNVAVLARGLYAITFQVQFTVTVTTGGIGLSIEERAAGTYTDSPSATMPPQPLANDDAAGYYYTTLIRSYPPIWVFDTTDALAPALPNWHFNVMQTSGSTKTAFFAMVEIHQLRAFDYETLGLGN